jgi:hypothetical protein
MEIIYLAGSRARRKRMGCIANFLNLLICPKILGVCLVQDKDFKEADFLVYAVLDTEVGAV